jgi:hypothetical protein
MEREQGARSDAEILLAGFAAPAWRTTGTTASPNSGATTVRAIWVFSFGRFMDEHCEQGTGMGRSSTAVR